MRILPLVYYDILSEEDVAEQECSDRIWIPRNEFQRRMTVAEPGILILLRLRNAVGQTVIGSAHSEHIGDEDIIYVPQWMYTKLDCDTDYVDIESFEASLCTRLILQPHTSDHLHVADPQELLRDAFERYSCLEPGETLPLWIEGRQITVTISDLLPKRTESLCIRNCEIELELLPPLDLPIPPPPTTYQVPPAFSALAHDIISSVPSLPSAPPIFAAGCSLGGVVDSSKSKRDLVREAALLRLKSSY